MPSWARWLVRATVSAALLALLVSRVDLQHLVPAVRAVPATAWVAVLGLYLGCHVLAAIKWRLLLGSAHVGLALAIRTHFLGLAANLFLPGLAGGDVVRAGVMGRESRDWGSVAVAGFTDRLIDTGTLVLLATVGAAWSAGHAQMAPRVILAATALVLLAAVGGYAAARWLGRGQRGWQRQLAAATDRLASRPALTLRVAALSVLIQALLVGGAATLGAAVGVQATPGTWLVVWTLAKLIAVVPVSLAGIGLREAALVTLFAPYGVGEVEALATGLTWESVLIAGALIGGGLAWMVARRRRTAAAGADA